jgi:hypothetical protein
MTAVTPPLVIDFDEPSHTYRVNGEVWPLSVTGILSRTGLVDFSHIPMPIRERAMGRGRRVHRAAHFLGEGTLDWQSVDEHEKGYVDAAANFLAMSRFVMGGHERRIIHPVRRYVGTVDLFGWWEDHCAIVDYCCGDLFDSCKHLQLAGYSEGVRHVAPPEWFDFTPSTPIARIGVHLKKTGKFTPEVYRDPRDVGIFMSAVTIAHYQLAMGKKGLVVA